MFRATVREVKSPTDVVVTIDKLFGGGMVRARSRIEVTAGERVLVDDLSAGRVHDWMVVDFENAIGRWGNTGPHTHPIGQVDGLKDFLDTYGEFMGDHEDRMKYAEGKLVEADAAIAQGRLDMAQAEQDLVAARDRITKAETELTYADQRISVGEAERAAAILRLDTAELEIQAAGTRIGATEDLLSTLDNRVESAETTVQVTAGKLDTVDTRLTTTAGELAALSGTVGDVSAAAAEADRKAAQAVTSASTAQEAAKSAMDNYTSLNDKLAAALASSDGLYDDSSYELATRNAASVPVIDVGSGAASGTKVARFTKGGGTGNVFTYWEYRPVTPGHVYRVDMKARAVAGNPVMESWVNYRRADGTQSGFVPTVVMDSLTTDWQRGYAEWTAPQDAVEARFFPIMPNHSNVEGDTADVDDHQVTDTTEQATLRLQVEDAKQAAEDAAKSAQAANTAAGLAQKAADGKTTITTNTSNPAGLGVAVGDIHVRMTSMSASGQIIGQWRWDGSNWVAQKIGSDFIAEMNVGKLTGTFANFTQHLSAGAITTPYLTVGVGRNLVPNGGGQAQGGWEDFGHNTSGPGQNNGYPGSFWLKGRVNQGSEQFPITPGVYACRVSAKGQHDGGRTYVQVNCFDNKGTRIGLDYLVANQVIPNGTWSDFSGEVTVPAGTVKAELFIYGNHPNGVVVDDYQWFTGFALEEMTDGRLVVNGAITGEKVDAQSVAAKIGQFVEVQAENVEVTSELATRVVNAMTANVRDLVVTESAILQHTTLLGTTIADELNVTKLLRGRDAILSGTIDVAQLNVTNTMSAAIVNAMDVATQKLVVTEEALLNHATLLGTTVAERLNVTKQLIGRDAILTGTVDVDQLNVTSTMSAEIVRAMDTTTKRLIVTEDAILNRATIVQDLVTRDLIAQRVDSRYLRSDSIQTGLLEVFGRFRTAPDGQPQVIIQPSQAAWNNADLAVWFTPDGTTPGGGRATDTEITGGMWMNPVRKTTTWAPAELNLRGQSRAGVRILDGLTVQATAGTVGPTINSSHGQFLNIIGAGGASLTTLNGPARITPWGEIRALARNGNVHIESAPADGEVRLHSGSGGVKFTNSGGDSWSYDITTSSQANLHMSSNNGRIYRVTSSKRYKKYVSDWKFDVTKLRDVNVLRKWRDRKLPGMDEDMDYHHGAIAEEVAELFPEIVPTIPDPAYVDENGEPLPDAPHIPDSIEYDRLALGVAVAGWQDSDRRLRALEEKLATLGI